MTVSAEILISVTPVVAPGGKSGNTVSGAEKTPQDTAGKDNGTFKALLAEQTDALISGEPARAVDPDAVVIETDSDLTYIQIPVALSEPATEGQTGQKQSGLNDIVTEDGHKPSSPMEIQESNVNRPPNIEQARENNLPQEQNMPPIVTAGNTTDSGVMDYKKSTIGSEAAPARQGGVKAEAPKITFPKITSNAPIVPKNPVSSAAAQGADGEVTGAFALVKSVLVEPVLGQNSVISAPVQLPQPKEFDNDKILKNSAEGNIIVASEDKRKPVGDAKGTSQHFAKEEGSAKNISDKPHGAKSQSSSSQKLTFKAEVTQNMTAGEGRAVPSTTVQMGQGLLVAQEVGQTSSQNLGLGLNQNLGQNLGQNNILNNILTPVEQVKPAPTPVSPEMVTRQISIAIAKQATNGAETFRISLKPAELGQVDIRMDFMAEGRITTTVVVENERVLHLLQKDQGALEKVLENAGAGGNDLNFTLKKQQHQKEAGEWAGHDHDADGDSDSPHALPESIIGHQHMKMAYSDNLLDINI